LQQNPRLPAFLLNEFNRNPERIKKLARNLDVNRLWITLEKQHKAELEKCGITRENVPQLMTSIAAMSVFPFVGKVLISGLMEKMGYDFDDYIEKRKVYAADFVIRALKVP
jgi:TetR/AcrR family transcriptional regulator